MQMQLDENITNVVRLPIFQSVLSRSAHRKTKAKRRPFKTNANENVFFCAIDCATITLKCDLQIANWIMTELRSDAFWSWEFALNSKSLDDNDFIFIRINC